MSCQTLSRQSRLTSDGSSLSSQPGGPWTYHGRDSIYSHFQSLQQCKVAMQQEGG